MSDYLALDPEYLREVVTTLCGQDGAARGAPFAHIQLPLYRDPEKHWMEAIGQAFQGVEGHITFVAPDNELAIAPNDISTLDIPLPASQISSQTLLDNLERSSSPSQRDGTPRYRYWKPGSWNKGLMPTEAIMVFYVDSSMKADTALALIGMIQWAVDMSTWPSSKIRVLTLSTGEHYKLISDLIQLCLPGYELYLCDLSTGYDWPHSDTLLESEDHASIFNEICNKVQNSPEASHLIISFDEAVNWSQEFSDCLAELKGGSFMIQHISSDFGPDQRQLDSIEKPPFNDAVVLLCNRGDLPLLPPIFRSYDNVHVIISEKLDRREGWHHKSRQVLEFYRYASLQERWTQLWWLEQPCGNRHLYSSGNSVEQVLAGGYRHHHQIEDAQLGGFIAAIYAMESWGIDSTMTVQCFLGSETRVLEMKKRLETQGILTNGRFAMSGSEGKAFWAALPWVRYDHRLALFAAIDCHPTIRLIKLQLAALIAQRIEEVVTLNDPEFPARLLNDGQLSAKLLRFCMGSVRFLAPQGTMWLAMGLWRTHLLLKQYRNGGTTDRDLEQLADVFRPFIVVLPGAATAAYLTWRNLKEALERQGIQVANIDLEHEHEIVLNESHQLEIQTHLFRGYMHQLLMAYRAGENFRQLNVSTMIDVATGKLPLMLTSVIDHLALWESERGNCLFGVSHRMRTEQASLMVDDWTWIPQRVVVQWLYRNHPGEHLGNVLAVRCNEIDQTIDEYN
ncbi:hypothetical protein FOCG_10461 [Fusarium oxysporum f. sp. radicis-lycopersici 26381]|nr:hypothetical protein FOCG_10461 [Fusarium oxysporum f. sp. radicis-lycopersici 26381]